MKKNPTRFIELLTPWLAVLVLLSATSCDRNDLLKLSGRSRDTFMQTNAAQRQEILARNSAEALRQGRYDEVVISLKPDIVGAQTRQSLIAMHDLLTGQEPASIKVIGARKFQEGDAEITEIVLDYEFQSMAKAASGSIVPMPARWVFLTFGVRSSESAPDKIDRINAVASEQPIERINAFTFRNKGVSQYAAFTIGILLSAFTIYAAVICIRSRIGPVKWLWILLMLFTVNFASVNWSSGQWSFHNISFKIGVPPIPANLTLYSGYGPWNLTLGLPIGAIAFVLYKRLWLGRNVQVPATSPLDHLSN